MNSSTTVLLNLVILLFKVVFGGWISGSTGEEAEIITPGQEQETCQCGQVNDGTADDQLRIIGGFNTTPNKYPWLAALFREGTVARTQTTLAILKQIKEKSTFSSLISPAQKFSLI